MYTLWLNIILSVFLSLENIAVVTAGVAPGETAGTHLCV